IMVEGRLQTSSYDDRDGNKRYKTEVVALNVILTGRKGDRAGGPSPGRDEDHGLGDDDIGF
ncbi:MAG: single-stranded DNA-binding protein, partial [Polyangiaceae bacterium]|nr:single-stranded DNA-binding protein [Polyangiaceae bacterium]